MGDATWTIIFSPESLQDLESIVLFIARQNPTRAITFGDELVDRTDDLEDFPYSGRIVPELGIEAIRELLHGSYRIIYRIRAVERSVDILRFWHGSQKTLPDDIAR